MAFFESSCSKVGGLRTGLATVLAILVVSIGTVGVAAGPLRYEPKLKQTFGYEVEIRADLPGEIETCKGDISYEVTSAGDLLKLKYQGGLTRTTKVKEGARSGNRGFPSHFTRGLPPGLFSGVTYRGLTQTHNVVTLTPRGKPVALEGTSQLPYLLGNLSLFVFEPLPETAKPSWTVETGVSVFQNDNSLRWGRSPFFHHRSNGQPDKTTAGSESTSFVAEGSKGDLPTFRKTYRLHSSDGDEETTVGGDGRWVFNRQLGIPESLDFKYTLVHKENNVTVTIPVTVQYQRISSEKWAKIESERKEKLRQFKEKQQQFQEEAKARSKERLAPLTDKRRREIIADLKSNDRHELLLVLMRLSVRKPHPDAKLARALEPLLSHSYEMVHDRAADALAKCSPEFARRHEITKNYSRSMPVDHTGPLVTAKTPLPHGLIVAAKRHRQWRAAKILRTLPNSQVEVQFHNWHDSEILSRSDIRLAPPEVEQPYVEKDQLPTMKPIDDADEADENDVASLREFRTWTDSSGTFAIVAKYVGIEGTSVRLLRKKDDKEVKVPLTRLSRADRQIVSRLRKAAGVKNPFEP